MTTLISYHTSGGCEGRCDAKCYNARTPHCDCICGGANHGTGLDRAIQNTRLMAESLLACDAQDFYEIEIPESVWQEKLPF